MWRGASSGRAMAIQRAVSKTMARRRRASKLA
jgi:hypothetical protein